MAFTKSFFVLVIVAISALGVEGSPFGALAQQPAKLFGTLLGGDKSPVKPLIGLASDLSERNPLQGMRSTDGLSKLSEPGSTLELGTDPSKLTGGEGSPLCALAQLPAKLVGTFLGGGESPEKPLTGLASELSERNPLQGMRPTDELSKLSESASTLGLENDPSKLTGGEGSPFGALAQQPTKLFGTFLGGDKSPAKPLTGLASVLRERNPLQGTRPADGLSKLSESASTLGRGTDPSKLTGGEGSPFGALAQQPSKLVGTFSGGDKSPVKPLTGLASGLRERNPLQGMRPTDGLSKLSESASTLGRGTDPSKLTAGHNLLSHGTSGMNAFNTAQESASR